MKTFREYVNEAKKYDFYKAKEEVLDYGYKEGEYNSQYTLFTKGPITVTVKKAKNNSNLKALIAQWDKSNYSYSFDEKEYKTVRDFLIMMDKKDPKRKPALSY